MFVPHHTVLLHTLAQEWVHLCAECSSPNSSNYGEVLKTCLLLISNYPCKVPIHTHTTYVKYLCIYEHATLKIGNIFNILTYSRI